VFCGTRSSLRIPASKVKTATLDDQNDIGRRRVFGTWDFKWPQGSSIQVAFQRLPQSHPALGQMTLSDNVQRELFQQVLSRASTWLESVDGKKPNINLEFHNSPEHWWPAPTPDGWAKSGAGGGCKYDVLVSLIPLDDVKEPKTDEQADGTVHLFPRAQLGTYSRRVPQGVPTVYLGRPRYLTERAPKHQPAAEYFNSDQFKHCIVHEFGHVLGLAHEHQNPKADPRWMEPGVIARILSEETKMRPQEFAAAMPSGEDLEDFVRQQITEPWPITKIDEDGKLAYKFSDWRDPPREQEGRYDFDSIMTDPMWPCFVDYPGVKAAIAADPTKRTLFGLHAPTASDLVQLGRMYPGQR
jgi:hypothetical protein